MLEAVRPLLPERVIDAAVRRPRRELLAEAVRELAVGRRMAAELLRRDLAAQHRQSLLGIALFFAPAVAIALWATLASRARIIDVGGIEIAYPAWVILGLALWQSFVDGMQLQVQGMLDARLLLARHDVPGEAVILARLGETFVNLGVKSLLVVAAFVVWRVPVAWATAWLAPVAVAALVLLGTAIGLLLAPLNLLYRDVGRLLGPVVTFWFFVTPVIYPVPAQGALRTLVLLNPATPLLVAARELLTRGWPSHPWAALAVAAAAPVAATLAWLAYRVALPVVVERVNA